MGALVEDWLRYLSTKRSLAANTVNTYRRTLRSLPDADVATRAEVEAWWREHAESDRTVSTRLNELSAVRSFYKWCQVWEHRSDDPTARIQPPRKPQRVHRYLGRSDLAKLLDQLPEDMARAVALGAYAGLRVSEAAALDWRDVDRELSRLTVRGKGDKERRAPLPTLLLDRLLPDTGGNVVRGGGEPYKGHTLQQKVNAAIRECGVQETFHALRHRFGMMSGAAGIPITSIAAAMGHASINTTAGYIGALDSDLDRIGEAVTR